MSRVVLSLLFLLVGFLPQVSFARQPNVILILADDLGMYELGCYGQKWIKTPHIDQLAKQGMKFPQFYSGQAVCAPARCVLMTGKHTGHSYVRNNGNPPTDPVLKEKYGWEFPGQFPIPDSEVTLAELLKGQGYATAGCGKWGLGHVGTTGDPNRQGFDLFYGFLCQAHAHNHYPRFLWRNGVKETQPGNDRTLNGETYSQDQFTKVALDFVRENKDQPFFLYLPFAIPHLSIQTAEESLAEYRGVIPEADYVHKGYLQHPHPRAGYAAMVSHMDRDIGKVLGLVNELGLTDDTIVIFTSDNGPTYDRLGGSDSAFFESAGNLRGFKGSLYDGGIRVPLIVRWPNRIAAGSTGHFVGAFWDLLPTICELVEIESPKGIDGLSFAPTLLGRDREQAEHEYLYWEFPAYGGQQAVRMGDWKGVRQQMMKNNLHIELYNLHNDPSESNDVSAEHPDVVRQIETLMRTARVPSEIYKFKPLDEWQAKAN